MRHRWEKRGKTKRIEVLVSARERVLPCLLALATRLEDTLAGSDNPRWDDGAEGLSDVGGVG